MAQIVPSRWTSIFPSSRVVAVTRYGAGEMREAGLVTTVAFELDGQPFVDNGGSELTFSEAISVQTRCETQDEIDVLARPRPPWRRGRRVRLAEGPLRRQLAGDALPDRGDDPRLGSEEGRARDGCTPADAEGRARRARARGAA